MDSVINYSVAVSGMMENYLSYLGYDIQVIDRTDNPELAQDARVFAEKAQMLAMQTDKDANVDLTPEEMADYIDDACDYMMLDSHDIMAYVTDDE